MQLLLARMSFLQARVKNSTFWSANIFEGDSSEKFRILKKIDCRTRAIARTAAIISGGIYFHLQHVAHHFTRRTRPHLADRSSLYAMDWLFYLGYRIFNYPFSISPLAPVSGSLFVASYSAPEWLGIDDYLPFIARVWITPVSMAGGCGRTC